MGPILTGESARNWQVRILYRCFRGYYIGYYIGVLEDEESIELVPDSVQSTSGPETTKRLFKKPQFDPNLSFAISSDH